MSCTDVLLNVATAARLFHASDGTGFADLIIDGHRETWPLRSKRFGAWLRQQYYERTWDAPSPAALNATLNVLEAQAQFDGPQRKVSVRLAEQDGLIYLDLADEFWRCVEIGPNGWRIAEDNGHVLAFDNLSGLPPWLSDTLCRLTSGGAFSTRRLFTAQDEILFSAARPVILNGIEDIVTRPDLADRAILLMLAPIAERQRRPEHALWREFELARPQILGALLDAAVAFLDRRGGDDFVGRGGVEVRRDLGLEGGLVSFPGEDVIRLVSDDPVGDLHLAAHGIDRDQGALSCRVSARRSSNSGMAVISLVFSGTLSWARVSRAFVA